MKNKKYNLQIIKYFLGGVLTTVVNYVIYILLTRFLRLNIFFSNLISWFGAVIFAYFINKKIVFDDKRSVSLKEINTFVYTRILSGGIEMFLLFVFVKILFLNDLISKVVISVIVIILNYLFSKKIFKT